MESIKMITAEMPKRYYYRHVRSINRDYTQLRWTATPWQQTLIEKCGEWREISYAEAKKMAREAAKWNRDHTYPYGYILDDEYIYPVGLSEYEEMQLCYHKSTRIADLFAN